MIKVPGTPEGIPAIRELIGSGINVNVTLLFAQGVYEKVAEAYIAGLEDFAAKGGDLSRVASVASFFVSRIDTLVDGKIAEMLKGSSLRARIRRCSKQPARESGDRECEADLSALQEDLQRAPVAGAGGEAARQTQRVLWASTGTKNPAYSDVLYVEELIGPDTVNTVPPATFDAFRNHGQPRASLEEGMSTRRTKTMADLGARRNFR